MKCCPVTHSKYAGRVDTSGYSISLGIFCQSPQDQAGKEIPRLVLSLSLVVIDVIKDITNKPASLGAAGHFVQEVSQIVMRLNVRESTFVHRNRLAALAVAD